MMKSTARQQARIGFTAFEAVISVATMSALLLVAAQLSGAMLLHRRACDRDRVVMDAKTNLMHMAMALPFDRVTRSELETAAEELKWKQGSWEIRVEDVTVTLPETDKEAELEAEAGTVVTAAKRVVIHLDSPRKYPMPRRPLVLWRYPVDIRPDAETRAEHADTLGISEDAR